MRGRKDHVEITEQSVHVNGKDISNAVTAVEVLLNADRQNAVTIYTHPWLVTAVLDAEVTGWPPRPYDGIERLRARVRPMIDPTRELSPRESKALRGVSEDRVHVQWMSSETNEGMPIAAAGVVDGFHDTYLVSFSPAGAICTCPAGANHQKCWHPLALEVAVNAADLLQLELGFV